MFCVLSFTGSSYILTVKIPLCLTHITLTMFVLLLGILFIGKVLHIRKDFLFVEEQQHQVSEQTCCLDRN